MSSKAKKTLLLVKMVSSENTGYYYLAHRNPKKKAEKMKFRKYDPVLRKHVLFEEKKLSS